MEDDKPPKRSRRERDDPPYPPRGMSRIESAYYIGVSPSLFDTMVKDRRMPAPKRINTRNVWDRFALDAAFEALPDKDQAADDDDRVTQARSDMLRRLPPGCVADKDRHGKTRIYYRSKGRRKVRLRGTPLTPEFMAQYEAAKGKPK
jgi:hypothetical protein